MRCWAGVKSGRSWEIRDDCGAARRERSLAGTGHIAGTVTGPDGAPPLAGIQVDVYWYECGSSTWVGQATTGADGRYDVGNLAAGVYRVRFYDPSGGYLTEYYNDAPDLAGGADVTVVEMPPPGISMRPLPWPGTSPARSPRQMASLRWRGSGRRPIAIPAATGAQVNYCHHQRQRPV